MNKLFFSVIITTYNRPYKLIMAVNSVINQNFQNFELIIVNDGSTSDYTKVLEHINENEKIKYFFKQNEERSVARNFGIEKAEGDWICFLDDDDYYLPSHLSSMHNLIEQNNFARAMYYSGTYIKKNKAIQSSLIPDYDQKIHTSPVYYIFKYFIMINSVCIEKSIFNEHKFLPQMNIVEDIHLWIRIAINYPFFYTNEKTTVCVIHPNRSGNDINFQKKIQYLKNIDDLFINYNLCYYIPKDEKKDFFISRYIRFSYKEIWDYNFRNFYFFFNKIIKAEKIYNILNMKYLLLLKEYFAFKLKKNGK